MSGNENEKKAMKILLGITQELKKAEQLLFGDDKKPQLRAVPDDAKPWQCQEFEDHVNKFGRRIIHEVSAEVFHNYNAYELPVAKRWEIIESLICSLYKSALATFGQHSKSAPAFRDFITRKTKSLESELQQTYQGLMRDADNVMRLSAQMQAISETKGGRGQFVEIESESTDGSIPAQVPSSAIRTRGPVKPPEGPAPTH